MCIPVRLSPGPGGRPDIVRVLSPSQASFYECSLLLTSHSVRRYERLAGAHAAAVEPGVSGRSFGAPGPTLLPGQLQGVRRGPPRSLPPRQARVSAPASPPCPSCTARQAAEGGQMRCARAASARTAGAWAWALRAAARNVRRCERTCPRRAAPRAPRAPPRAAPLPARRRVGWRKRPRPGAACSRIAAPRSMGPRAVAPRGPCGRRLSPRRPPCSLQLPPTTTAAAEPQHSPHTAGPAAHCAPRCWGSTPPSPPANPPSKPRSIQSSRASAGGLAGLCVGGGLQGSLTQNAGSFAQKSPPVPPLTQAPRVPCNAPPRSSKTNLAEAGTSTTSSMVCAPRPPAAAPRARPPPRRAPRAAPACRPRPPRRAAPRRAAPRRAAPHDSMRPRPKCARLCHGTLRPR